MFIYLILYTSMDICYIYYIHVIFDLTIIRTIYSYIYLIILSIY